MSPLRRAPTPRTALYRIGRLPDPLAWPPWAYAGNGRFDDPAGDFRVLYAAAQRRAAFIETLAPFCLSVEALTALQGVTGAEDPLPMPVVPPDWYRGRAVGRFRLAPRQRWLDLRSFETREVLRRELAQTLLDLSLEDLDLSGVVGPRRQLTQAIAPGPANTVTTAWSTVAASMPHLRAGPSLRAPSSSLSGYPSQFYLTMRTWWLQQKCSGSNCSDGYVASQRTGPDISVPVAAT